MSLSDRLFCNHHAHPLRQAWSYRLRCAKEVFVWFKSRLNPWYISIPSNPNLYSTKIIMKMRWQTIASSVSMRTISPTATPLPTANDCVAVYIAGRRTNLVVYTYSLHGFLKIGPDHHTLAPCTYLYMVLWSYDWGNRTLKPPRYICLKDR